MATYRRRQIIALRQALDEARFGPDRTLNLRASLPTAQDAAARADLWLRERQMQQVGEVLVVTGRGNNSPGGVSVVRDAVEKLLRSLKRKGVVTRAEQYTPGSFVVTLAPVSALWETPRRTRGGGPAVPPADPPTLAALEPETRRLLRDLALRSLAALGMRDSEPFLEREMLAQFGAIAAGVPEGPGRERRLREAAARAIEEYDAR